MNIYIIRYVSDDLIEALNRLIPQLDPTVPVPDIHALSRIVNSPSSKVFVVEEKGKIIATATLVIFEVATGRKVWLEDLVVESSLRRKGIGEKLVRHILDYAKEEGIERVDLTSNTQRLAAHQLYKKVGFAQRESNIFRKKL